MREKKLRRRDIVVVGGSAGSIEPLKLLAAGLPADFGGAVFVVLHVSPSHPSLLPAILRAAGPLPAFHAKDQEPVRPGSIYIAPPDFHMLLENGVVRVVHGAHENRHRPAVDPTFRSAARTYGSRVAGVVLSGYLDDGSAGLLAIKMAGGLSIVQDPAEALCPEMPTRAIEYAGADRVLSISEITALLADLARQPPIPIPPPAETTMMGQNEAERVKLSNHATRDRKGKPSPFSCPECHGVLWELEGRDHLRFRCRVGHAFTAEVLRVALSQSTEDALWAAMRVLEEKAALLRQISRVGGRYAEQANQYEKHATIIRDVLMENQATIQEENHTPAPVSSDIVSYDPTPETGRTRVQTIEVAESPPSGNGSQEPSRAKGNGARAPSRRSRRAGANHSKHTRAAVRRPSPAAQE
ncbi:MAG: chemotaxis protein CheB [Terriglobia bacterium]